MPTFVGITDIHMAQRLSRYRPNAAGDIIAKVSYAAHRAYELDAALLCAGDWFHRADCSFGTVSRLADVVAGVPNHVVGVTGQHDLPDHGDWRRGPTYSMSWRVGPGGLTGDPIPSILRLGSPHGLSGWPSFLLLPYGAPLTPEALADAAFAMPERAGCSVDYGVGIIIVHAMLTPKPVAFDHILLSDFEQRLPQDGRERVVFSGDLHNGYDVQKINDTWFCNPGALTRTSRDDAQRQPQLLVLEWSNGVQNLWYEPVPCRPAEEAFDMEGYGVEQESPVERDSEFAAALQQLGERAAAGMELSMASLDVSEEVRDAIEAALGVARERLGYK